MKNLSKQISFLMVFGASFLASPALAGNVLKCKEPSSRMGRVCLIKSEVAKNGDEIIIKDAASPRFIKANGVVVADRGDLSVVSFPDTREFINVGDQAEVISADRDGLVDYKTAFSKDTFF